MKGFGWGGELFTGGSTSAGRGLVFVGGVTGRHLESLGSWVGGLSPEVTGLERGGPRHCGRGGLGCRVARFGRQGMRGHIFGLGEGVAFVGVDKVGLGGDWLATSVREGGRLSPGLKN
ncbi:hypothetical protein TIFTF001_017312 [Ficus carica]|uniref:Uncharacterized protein n=1 Tax=Ficus carica TaxID=3494 RepID=A0AA88AU84_FICCA|nr:hypothetical protein TIFTF001_017312 [Ficus carica]